MATRKTAMNTEEVKTTKEIAKSRYEEKTSIPNDYEIPVKSNVQGLLIYENRSSKYHAEWGAMGDIEYIEFRELIAMRNTQRAFFADNMIVVEESDYTPEQVYKALSVDKYYQFMIDDMDKIFSMTKKELEKIVPTLSSGFKENIIARAREFKRNENPIFDSAAKCKMFEGLFDFKFASDIEE